jgi:hypothetical protein
VVDSVGVFLSGRPRQPSGKDLLRAVAARDYSLVFVDDADETVWNGGPIEPDFVTDDRVQWRFSVDIKRDCYVAGLVIEFGSFDEPYRHPVKDSVAGRMNAGDTLNVGFELTFRP